MTARNTEARFASINRGDDAVLTCNGDSWTTMSVSSWAVYPS